MPFDGVVTKCVSVELQEMLLGGRIEKVFQPEADEIILTVRSKGQNLKVLVCANANYPRIHLTEYSKENPATPPVFCMLLRKHLSGGKIVGVEFNDFERILGIQIEAVNELGDMTIKKLIIEIMGRHSNIILVNQENRILDAIKHIDSEISSVREVMPARTYVLPPAQDKTSPERIDAATFFESQNEATGVEKYLLNHIKGFSPLLSREICSRARIDGRQTVEVLMKDEVLRLKEALEKVVCDIKARNFKPCIAYEDEGERTPVDFHCLLMEQYGHVRVFQSISKALDDFYSVKDKQERLRQKKSGIQKSLGNNLERCKKKLTIQEDTLREVADREQLRLFGELITANIYCIPQNTAEVSLVNYYSENGERLTVPLDANLTPQANAQRYFKKYSRAKSTYTNTCKFLEETRKELEYLESVQLLLDHCTDAVGIDEIREELTEEGYIAAGKKKSKGKKRNVASKPMHYMSSDGMDIYVGKNNHQNDLLTMKLASSSDIWLHTRNIPGSHVVIRKQGREVSEGTLLEAGMLAAYHSRAKMSANVPVDYTQVRDVKKPPGAKPGMVIYEKFSTLIVTPSEETERKLSENKELKT